MKQGAGRSIIFVAAFVAVYLTSTQVGLDGVRYASWAKVAITGDISELSHQDRLSPMSVPFFQWNAGPGLMMVPFFVVFDSARFVHVTGTEFAGRVYGLAFWILFFVTLREAWGLRLALLGIAMAFVATPLGFYSINASSECFSLLPAAVLTAQTIRLARNQDVHWWLTASATGLLLMIRPYLGVFAWPVLLVGVWIELQQRGSVRCAQAIGITGFCILLAALQIASTQYWMTGDPFHSPYSFGDGDFRSLSLSNPPYLWQVLLDTFHGVLPTHPLMGLGMLLSLGLAVEAGLRRDWRVAAIWWITIIAVSINVWFQSAWYYTCMCWISFGMRGLILPSIPATAAILIVLRRSERARIWVLSLVTICVVWSYLRLRQGPRSDLTWPQLLAGQGDSFVQMISGTEVWLFAGTAGLLSLAYRTKNSVSAISLVLASLAFVYLTNETMRHKQLLAMVILTFAVAFVIWTCWNKLRYVERVSWLVPVVFVICICTFGRLAIQVYPTLKPNDANAMTFQEGDVRSYYKFLREQNRQDFVDKRAQLEAFFRRSRRPDWVLP